MVIDQSDPVPVVYVDGVAVDATTELAWLERREGMQVELGALSDLQERELHACYEQIEDSLRALPITPAPCGWRDRILASIEEE